ncbi:internalin-like protein [Bifidobacterium dolichotidis]|uniref:Internalin-like protein n=1 Tax=Bifidobacterium dolichotidis TaxID=2306976 RepID=A0A430FPJ7_9BIFI|nr:hypothetical protein [Bifidobacterium dolichotidis]RSX54724.1 internalin-like protein [Bifidobacterium dolichotidis]
MKWNKAAITWTVALAAAIMPFGAGNAVADTGAYRPNEDIVIDSHSFPDPAFREYIATHWDTDKDGILSWQERLDAKELRHTPSFGIEQIKDLSGIEYFPNVETIAIRGNKFYRDDAWIRDDGRFDISQLHHVKNLDVAYTGLFELHLQSASQLQSLHDEGNNLQSIDLSQNAQLTSVNLSNNHLTSLTLPNQSQLQELNAANNAIEQLELSPSSTMREISIQNNKVSSLDVTSLPQLERLNVTNNALTSLSVSKNPRLQMLSAGGNQLATLDVSNNTDLETLDLTENQLAAVDLSHNAALTYVSLANNQLATLDLTNNTLLQNVYLSNNQLTGLDLSKNTNLERLIAEHNRIGKDDIRVKWDISANTKLKELNVADNGLWGVDLSTLTNLTQVNISNNHLDKVGIEHLTNLQSLDLRYNRFRYLNLPYQGSDGRGMRELRIANNPLLAVDIAAIPERYDFGGWEDEGRFYPAGDLTINLSTEAKGIDLDKIHDVQGARLKGRYLTAICAPSKASYEYDMGAGMKWHASIRYLGG